MLKRIFLGLGLLIVIAGLWLTVIINDTPSALEPDPSAPRAVLIDNVRLLSMVPGAPLTETNRAVLVIGDQIEAVGAAGSLSTPEGALYVDGQGRTLLPGLIDAHVHVWDEAELAGYLAHGVTGIRNMGGMPFHLPLAERLSSGELLGPDFITVGPILNSPGVNQQANQKIVVAAEEARTAVKEQYDAGFRAIKLYSNLTREAYEAALEEAQRLGMSYSGHTPEGIREKGIPHDKPFTIAFEESLGRGFQTIEHTESIVWHGLRDTRDETKMQALALQIKSSGDVVSPTLIAHDNLVRVAKSKGAYLNRPGTDTINPALRMIDEGTYEFWSNMDPTDNEEPRGLFYRKATKIMYDAGVAMVAGTDAGIFVNLPGSAMTRELELLVGAGIPAHAALIMATRNGGKFLGFEKTGVIAPGWRANLILLDEDPLENISAVENPAAVMIGGNWLDQADLEQMRDSARDTSVVRSFWRIGEFLLTN